MMNSLHLLLLLTVVSGLKDLSIQNCPESFENKCYCGVTPHNPYEPELKYLVNCTNTAFTDTDMLEDLPEETQVLIFVGNKLDELEDNIFGFDTPHDKLQYIDMSNNHITFIKGRTFHKVMNVERLILNYNEIMITGSRERPRIFSNFANLKALHLTDAFTDKYNASHYYLLKLEDIFIESFLTQLERLHLEQNEIYSIGINESIFCPLRSIQHLYLADNKLLDMDFKIDCLEKLNFIDLRFNMISRLSDDAMDRMDAFHAKGRRLTLHMKDNPFMCDCRASRFLRWVGSSDIPLKEIEAYKCFDGYPEENIDTKLIDVRHVTCPGDLHRGYSSGTVGFLSFLVVFLALLIVVMLFYHKQKLSAIVRPLMDDFTSKMGYTGLSHEDAPQEVNV